MDTTKLSIEIWGSDFLLPSVDYRSLQFAAAARICAAPVQVFKTNKPWKSPSGELPVFRHGTAVAITDFKQYVQHLKKQLPELTLDSHLERSELAELQAYSSLLEEKLRPAYLQTFFCDRANFNVITSRWYAAQLPLFYGFYYCGRVRQSVERYLRFLYPGELVTWLDIEYQVIKNAITCVKHLAMKLDTKKFFFGDKPSSLDALVFGYLAPLLKIPLPTDKLQQELKNHPNLVRLVDSMISVYMPLSDEELTIQRSMITEWEARRDEAQATIRREADFERGTQPAEESAEEFRIADKIIFAVGAIVATTLFAVHFGFINVQLVGQDADEDAADGQKQEAIEVE